MRIPGFAGFPFLSVISDLQFWLGSPVYRLVYSLTFLYGSVSLLQAADVPQKAGPTLC